MDWTAVAAVGSVVGTFILGVLTLSRGSKSDKALNMATNVQSTYSAQKDLVDNLQEEVARHQVDLERYRALTQQCEAECRECKSNLAGSRLIIAAQEAEIEQLKTKVDRLEHTLANISRREDQVLQEGDQERRQT